MATSGSLHMANSGYFFMATDTYEAVARFTQALRTLAEEPQLLADLS